LASVVRVKRQTQWSWTDGDGESLQQLCLSNEPAKSAVETRSTTASSCSSGKVSCWMPRAIFCILEKLSQVALSSLSPPARTCGSSVAIHGYATLLCWASAAAAAASSFRSGRSRQRYPLGTWTCRRWVERGASTSLG